MLGRAAEVLAEGPRRSREWGVGRNGAGGGQETAGAGAGGREGGGGVVLALRRLGSIFMTVIHYLLHSAIKLDRPVLGSWWSER